MIVRMVKPQFANLVKSGEKCQTVRPVPKRMPKVGEAISLREWTGKPYRSKQRVLKESTVAMIWSVHISANFGISVEGFLLGTEAQMDFAKADGFNTAQDMIDWFNYTHGLPFDGICIYWKP